VRTGVHADRNTNCAGRYTHADTNALQHNFTVGSFAAHYCGRTSFATQPIMIGWARRIMIRLEGPAHARVPI